MKASLSLTLLLGAACLATTGCDHFPGKPGPEPDVPRPEQVLDFATLYKQNCAACHGEQGVRGASLSLANPAYLAYAGEANLRTAIAQGVHGSLMPAFAQGAGGMLTDQQVEVLAHGLITNWGKPNAVAGASLPAYHPATPGDVAMGQKNYEASCAHCHGEDGQGTRAKTGKGMGSIVDPSYLALVSDQYLRSVIVGGLPGQGMPDFAHHGAPGTPPHVMTDAEVTSVVAWLESHRTGTTQAAQPTQTAPTPAPKPAQSKQEPL